MSRPLRITYPGAWYHIMNRGLARNNIYLNNKHREVFLQLLLDIHNRFEVEIHAYCLMDNHYHLLLRTPLGNISRAMRHLDGVYTQRFNIMTNSDEAIFRGRYKSILVDADSYLLRLSRYIHLNPVKAGLVKEAEKYHWSSYKNYISTNHFCWLSTDQILGYINSSNPRYHYKLFVEDGVDAEIDNFYRKIKRLPILGSDTFTINVSEKYLSDRHKVKDIPEHKILSTVLIVDINTIINQVATYYGVNQNELRQVNKKNGNLPRAVGMYIAQVTGQYTSTEIARAFTNISSAGVLKSCKNLQSRISNEIQLRGDIDRLKYKIKELKLEVEI